MSTYIELNEQLEIIDLKSFHGRLGKLSDLHDFFSQNTIDKIIDFHASNTSKYSRFQGELSKTFKTIKDYETVDIHLGKESAKRLSLHIYPVKNNEQKKSHHTLVMDSAEEIFNNSILGIVLQEENGDISLANKAAEEILGLTYDQMIGRKSTHPEWRAVKGDGSPFPGEEHPAMVSLKTGRKIYNTEMGVYHPKKKEMRWILINAKPIIDENTNKPNAVYTYFLDITEIKRLSNLLTENKQLSALQAEHLKKEAQAKETLLKISNAFINPKNNVDAVLFELTLSLIAEQINADSVTLFYLSESNKLKEVSSSRLSDDMEGVLPSKLTETFVRNNLHMGQWGTFPNTSMIEDTKEIFSTNSAEKTLKSLYTSPLFGPEGDKNYFIQIEYHESKHELSEFEREIIELFLGTLEDFKRKKQLNWSVERNNRIIKNSLNEIYLFDANSLNFIYFNDAVLKNTQYSVEELKKMNPLDLKLHLNEKQFRNKLEPLLKNKLKSINFDSVHTRKDKSKYDVVIYLEYFNSNKESFYVAIIRDVSKEKAALRKLKENRKLLQGVFTESKIPMLISTAHDYKIVNVNNAMRSFLDESHEQYIGQSISKIASDEFIEKLKTIDRKNYSSFKTTHKSNGKLLHLEIHSSMIRIENELYIYSMIIDETEKVESINQIISQNELLKEVAWKNSHKFRAPVSKLLTIMEVIDVETSNKKELETDIDAIRTTVGEIDEIIHDINKSVEKSKDVENKRRNYD